jgi:hypothetical protein
LRAAFLVAALLVVFFFLIGAVAKVFNTTVENSVEKHESIPVSDSDKYGSALCTGASAGTFVLQPSAGGAWFFISN